MSYVLFNIVSSNRLSGSTSLYCNLRVRYEDKNMFDFVCATSYTFPNFELMNKTFVNKTVYDVEFKIRWATTPILNPVFKI